LIYKTPYPFLTKNNTTIFIHKHF